MRLLKEGKEIPAELEEKLKGKKSPQKSPVAGAQTGSSKKEEGDVQQLTEKVCMSGLEGFILPYEAKLFSVNDEKYALRLWYLAFLLLFLHHGVIVSNAEKTPTFVLKSLFGGQMY